MTLFDSFPRADLLDGRVADVFEARTMEDLEAIGRNQHLPTQVSDSPVGVGERTTGHLDFKHGKDSHSNTNNSHNLDFDTNHEPEDATPTQPGHWAGSFPFRNDKTWETDSDDSNGGPPTAQRTSTTFTMSNARSTTKQPRTRSKPPPTSASISSDDDWFRDKGEVLQRGDDKDGIRRSGRKRRTTPPTHSTHSHFAGIKETTSDSSNTGLHTEHVSRTQAFEDSSLIPAFLANEVKSTSKDNEQWEQADQREWDGLISMGCFQWVKDDERLESERIYSSRYVRVVKDKYSVDDPKHYKSRIVVQQLKRIHHDDPGELYSPTPSQESARLLTWHAARTKQQIQGIDCVQAYLNSPAPTQRGKRIFIRPPKERKRDGYILLLLKYLYGLRRAAKAWNKTLLKAFETMGFRRLRTELCVLIRDHSGNKPTIVDFHVDDIRVIGNTKSVIKGLDRCGIKVTYEGVLKRHLGIEYEFRPEGIFTHMRTAELKLLKNIWLSAWTMQDIQSATCGR